MPAASLFDRFPMTRVKPCNFKRRETVKRPRKFYPATPRKIIPPETTVRKDRISADKYPLPLRKEADASRSVTRSMEDR